MTDSTPPKRRLPQQIRAHAMQIWRAGVDAVRSDRLVFDCLDVEGSTLNLAGVDRLDLDRVGRIVVVGAGKAGAGMAAGVEQVLGRRLMKQKQLGGWVNVPADCVRKLRRIHLHAARPPGVNEPTAAGVKGSMEILRLVGSLGPDDLCLVLLSGGGSALLPAPAEGVALNDKLAVTRHLSAAGADIQELNTVRKQLSRIKGGGLLRACRAGRLVTLIISDVPGDPLDVIASGPTERDSSTPQAALEVLEAFDARRAGISRRVFDYLEAKRRRPERREPTDHPAAFADLDGKRWGKPTESSRRALTMVIANNATAVEAAGREAERLGYSPAMQSVSEPEGPAEIIGIHLAEMAQRMRDRPGPDCLISGGEPVVKLIDADQRGRGGRNQQLVLAALERLADDGARGVVILSGGTDGEDGPTDAAGAWLDASVLASAQGKGFDAAEYLCRNDAYRFFEPLDALIKTGPTHTNVCDLRVVVVDRVQ